MGLKTLASSCCNCDNGRQKAKSINPSDVLLTFANDSQDAGEDGGKNHFRSQKLFQANEIDFSRNTATADDEVNYGEYESDQEQTRREDRTLESVGNTVTYRASS